MRKKYQAARKIQVTVYVNRNEYDEIQANALNVGLPVSAYVRIRALHAAMPQGPTRADVLEERRQMRQASLS